MAYAGLRPAEAMALRWSDVEPDAIAVPALPATRPGPTARRVPLWRPLAVDLETLRRQASAGDSDRRVFAQDGVPFDLAGWRDTTYARLSSEAGLESRRPAALRHIFCALMINAGVSVDELSRLVDMERETLIENFKGLWNDLSREHSITPEESISRSRSQLRG
jgi:integrase